jgi:hypothetical protein
MVSPTTGSPKAAAGRKATAAARPGGKAAAPAKPAAKSKPKPPKTPKTPTPASLMAAQLAQAQAMMAEGRALPNHLARVVRDAWLADLGPQVWASTAAVAEDLGVSASTVQGWAADGAPIQGHSPVAKVPLLRWLWERERAKAAGRQDESAAAREAVELRLKIARATAAENTLRQEAADFARQILTEELRAAAAVLLRQGPARIREAVEADQAEGADAQTIDARIASEIQDLLSRVAAERAASTPTPTPAHEATP